MGKKDEIIEATVHEDVDDDSGKKDKPKKSKKFKAPPGPLAPFRLSLAVLVSAVTTGIPLWHAWSSGVDVDIALGRSFAVAFVLWIVLGRISRMLGMAQLEAQVEAEVERRRAAMHAVGSPGHGHKAADHHASAVDDATDIHHAA